MRRSFRDACARLAATTIECVASQYLGSSLSTRALSCHLSTVVEDCTLRHALGHRWRAVTPQLQTRRAWPLRGRATATCVARGKRSCELNERYAISAVGGMGRDRGARARGSQRQRFAARDGGLGRRCRLASRRHRRLRACPVRPVGGDGLASRDHGCVGANPPDRSWKRSTRAASSGETDRKKPPRRRRGGGTPLS